MGALALLWAPLLGPLLLVLLGQPPGTVAQTQVCSVDNTLFQVEENSDVTEPLVDIQVPEGQQVALGSSSTRFAFRIVENQLFLNVTPDYEETPMLEAHLECKRGDTVVTQLRVFVAVLDVNDNAPEFPFTIKEQDVAEDTKVNSTVIPEAELQAEDRDADDVLFYTLWEVTPDASSFFSLEGANRPALRLDQALDFYKTQSLTFLLLARDTWEEDVEPSHTATATLVLNVLPADLRPPWFLPCTYSDGYVCIQAQYHGAVPTGHTLPSPLVLRPGPIYAVDGDQGINQRILYSIIGGNEDSTFAIDTDSGNLTMARSIPSPTTFFLLVRADQADRARYSVTQVTVEAQDATGSLPHFPQSLYCGTVAPGSGAGVAVKDAADPSQSLRIWAQDPEFPDLNSAITYRITNCSEFRMDGEVVLTAVALEDTAVFYAEVEANNTVTAGTATTVAEIHVSEQEPACSGTSWPTAPTAATGASPGTVTPGGGSASTPKPGTPQSTAPTVATGTSPGTATPGGGSTLTLKPGTTWPTAPTMGTGTSPGTATPGGGSASTLKPGTTRPTAPTVGTSTTPGTAMPGGGTVLTQKPGTTQPTAAEPSGSPTPSVVPGGGSAGGDGEPDGSGRFSTVDMAVLGGVLGALLLLALIALAVLVIKHYGRRLSCCSSKAAEPQRRGLDNHAFPSVRESESSWTPTPTPEPGPEPAEAPPAPPSPASPDPASPGPASPGPTSPGPASLGRAAGSPAAARAADSPSAVRSILTKERRPEGGYKAVWFGEDIGAEADVVVLNAPPADAGDSTYI